MASSVLAWGGRYPWRVEVQGQSMEPELVEGDRLVVAPPWCISPGCLVVCADPRLAGRVGRGSVLMVKRVSRLDATGVVVIGDNPAHSTDSRHFGPIPRSAVRGVALYRYYPPERAGWLRRAPMQSHPQPLDRGSICGQ
ncbi:MAG: S26 family signal peptidase [Acidimicrobiales bacterium]